MLFVRTWLTAQGSALVRSMSTTSLPDKVDSVVPDQAEGGSAVQPIRLLRVVAFAVPLIVLNCGWIANSEIRNNLTEGTVETLFLGVIFILFLVTLANLLVRRTLGPRAAYSQGELMLLYTMLSMSSAIAGVSHIGFLTLFLASPFEPSTSNPLSTGFVHMLPSYIGPRDPAVLHGFYKGNSTFFEPQIMAAWAWPLLVWGLFLALLLWTQLCLCSIVRRRWADEEHLPFPVIVLPLEITRENAPIYRNKLFWAGCAIPAFLHTLNTLSSLIPNVPSMPINSWHDIGPGFSYPWSGAGIVLLLVHPVGVGFGYLVNTDALFSLWFFYVLDKCANVLGVATGWRSSDSSGWNGDSGNQFPFATFQSWGAWTAVVVTTLWTSRTYLKAYYERAVGGDPHGIDNDEALTARWAVGGFVAGFLALCSFVWIQGGSIWLPVAFFGGYLMIMLGIARVRAEMPILATSMNMLLPQALTMAVGPGSLSPLDTVHVGMLSWFNLDYRSTALPQELEGMVALKRAKSRLSPIVWGILIASVVGIAAAMIWDLQMYYVNGADSANVQNWRNMYAAEPWQQVGQFLRAPTPGNSMAVPAMAFGFLTVFILSALRARFTEFPLVPAAYTVNVSGMNDFFWCDMFVAWMIKCLVLRYGGRKLYQTGLPFFLGLILGDFGTGAAWCLYGTLTHTTLFRTFPV